MQIQWQTFPTFRATPKHILELLKSIETPGPDIDLRERKSPLDNEQIVTATLVKITAKQALLSLTPNLRKHEFSLSNGTIAFGNIWERNGSVSIDGSFALDAFSSLNRTGLKIFSGDGEKNNRFLEYLLYVNANSEIDHLIIFIPLRYSYSNARRPSGVQVDESFSLALNKRRKCFPDSRPLALSSFTLVGYSPN